MLSHVRWAPIWGLAAAACLCHCVEPQPKTLTLPSAKEANRQVRRALAEFNSERFNLECASIDSAIQLRGGPSEALPGGIRLVRQPGSILQEEEVSGTWFPETGHRVRWSWVAYSLDGDSMSRGESEFAVDRDAVPRCFHEAAKKMGHDELAEVWSPSVSAFGVRGVPGEIPPFTSVRLAVHQQRSIQDTAWLGSVQRGTLPEPPWLNAYVESLEGKAQAVLVDEGLHLALHTKRLNALRAGQVAELRIRTQSLCGGEERTTRMEWVVGTPDQLVSGLEKILALYPRAATLTVWCSSAWAFGAEGVPDAGILSRCPVRFDVEVVAL